MSAWEVPERLSVRPFASCLSTSNNIHPEEDSCVPFECLGRRDLPGGGQPPHPESLRINIPVTPPITLSK
ncbi:hypothetical protein CEXT_551631 [Caerostris extrusa]|uniref:Uncharacterized protein n=1 Tax=Caerostris extrusa TaxID=172846 RepID=A0AAV4SYC2_CAEEX|nr:hypothetical protein CEXT_551631 [Caerostris extrusa]